MSLQKYVQQLKPIQENYIKPDSRVQNLVESNTEYATLMEKAIVMAYNMKKKGRSEDEAENLVIPGYESDVQLRFATGMNGDEDLGQNIIMKGDKYHYNQAAA